MPHAEYADALLWHVDIAWQGGLPSALSAVTCRREMTHGCGASRRKRQPEATARGSFWWLGSCSACSRPSAARLLTCWNACRKDCEATVASLYLSTCSVLDPAHHICYDEVQNRRTSLLSLFPLPMSGCASGLNDFTSVGRIVKRSIHNAHVARWRKGKVIKVRTAARCTKSYDAAVQQTQCSGHVNGYAQTGGGC